MYMKNKVKETNHPAKEDNKIYTLQVKFNSLGSVVKEIYWKLTIQ